MVILFELFLDFSGRCDFWIRKCIGRWWNNADFTGSVIVGNGFIRCKWNKQDRRSFHEYHGNTEISPQWQITTKTGFFSHDTHNHWGYPWRFYCCGH